MRIIFCQNPIEPKRPDDLFQVEWDAAKEHGFECSLLDFEALVNGSDPVLATRKIDAGSASNPEEAIFRGWMLSPTKYAPLYDCLLGKNLKLINDANLYKHCHYLPEWLPELSERTPKSVSLSLSSGQQAPVDLIKQMLSTFNQGPVVVKDYVKSEKHRWKEACFIPSASDFDDANKVIQRFLELRGDDLEGGLVLREFVEFKSLATHSKSGMPLTQEFRFFVLDGKIIYCAEYWDEGDYGDVVPPIEEFEEDVARIPSRFFTMDVALCKSGEWQILELGDGQVSGLPEDSCAEPFYRALKQQLSVSTQD